MLLLLLSQASVVFLPLLRVSEGLERVVHQRHQVFRADAFVRMEYKGHPFP